MKPARSIRSSAEEGSQVRFVLGMAQMFLAGVAAVLLVETGASAVTLAATCLATAVTVTSRWLYHRQRRARSERSQSVRRRGDARSQH